MDDKYKQIRADFDWYVKLLSSLCGEYEEWKVCKGRKTHRCEFGHAIPEGTQYLRKIAGSRRAEDVKLCEDCGVGFLYLLFGTGSGTAQLATRLVRRRYGSLLIALRSIERNREEGQGRERAAISVQNQTSTSRPPEVQPKWSATRLAEVRIRHPRAYEKWTATEDRQLRRLASSGTSTGQMARELQRQPSAIRSRMSKLGLSEQGLAL